MEFPAFEWIRVSRKWNISAAREQWGLGRFLLKCSMGRIECYERDVYHVESILGNPRYFSYFPCDSLSIMNEAEVVRIVGSSSAKKNENLLASVKSMLEDSLNELKRSQGDTADSHLKGSLTSRITSKIKVTKVDADLTLSPWRHWRGGKGKLLLKRQKHILLAEKSNFGWSLIWEYKRRDLADLSDDETKIYQSISQSAYPS